MLMVKSCQFQQVMFIKDTGQELYSHGEHQHCEHCHNFLLKPLYALDYSLLNKDKYITILLFKTQLHFSVFNGMNLHQEAQTTPKQRKQERTTFKSSVELQNCFHQ